MKKRLLVAAGVAGLLVLAGCQSGDRAETEQLKQQIAQLEQQVTELENSSASDTADDTASADTADDTANTANTADTSTDAEAADTAAGDATAASDASAGNTGTAAVLTIDELTTKVDAFVEKADAEAASSAEKVLENYFTLKQEAEEIDRELERYEDDLEYQYRNGSLTRDDYRTKEREADLLEDKLDAAEDTLEYVYGIDD